MRTAQGTSPLGTERHAPNKGMLSDIDLKILWVSRALSEIDRQFEPEFRKIQHSTIPKDFKRPLREALTAKYRERCAPYLKLLLALRRQQR